MNGHLDVTLVERSEFEAELPVASAEDQSFVRAFPNQPTASLSCLNGESRGVRPAILRDTQAKRWAEVVCSCLAGMLVVGAVASCSHTQDRKKLRLSTVHLQLGEDYLKKKMPELAKAELLKSAKLNDRNQQAHALLGAIFFFEGLHADNFIDRRQCLSGEAASEQKKTANEKFHTAEKHLKRAVSLARESDQTDSESLNFLSNIALHFHRYNETIKFADGALNNILYGNRHLALSAKGRAYLGMGNLKFAARDLRQALFHQPKFCVGRFWLAKVYEKQNHPQQAIDELQRIFDDKTCPIQEAYRLHGVLLMKRRDRTGARAAFDRCVSKNPQSCISQECKRYLRLISLRGLLGENNQPRSIAKLLRFK